MSGTTDLLTRARREAQRTRRASAFSRSLKPKVEETLARSRALYALLVSQRLISRVRS